MTSSAQAPAVVQKFKPTGGAAVGWTSIAAFGLVAGLTLVTERDLFAVRVALGLGLLMILTWVTLIRPRADATQETLRLRNLFSDHLVPLAHVEDVAVRQMLCVWVGQRRYTCVGIGRSARQLLGNRRKRGPMAVLGLEQTEDRMGMGDIGDADATTDYATFVEVRIEDLARTAKRDLPEPSPEVRREWARPEIAALVAVGAAFVVSLLV